MEQLLGIDLSELDDIVDIRLGLRAADLLGEPVLPYRTRDTGKRNVESERLPPTPAA